MNIKLIITVLAAALTLALILALIWWVAIPIKARPGAVDASVSFANAAGEDAPQFSEAYFAHDGHSLHYVTAGEGEVVLFVHGFPSYWFAFTRQMQALKKDYRVVAIDGLGAGMSDAPGDVEAYRLEAMAAHVNALIEHIGVDSVHLVGHDWGAAFVLGFAQRYPRRVRTVTGISAPPQSVMLELIEKNEEQRENFAYIERVKKANSILLLALGVGRRIYSGAYGPLVADGKLSEEEGELFRRATGSPKRVNAHINWYRANVPAFDEITDGDFWPSRKARVSAPALFIWGLEDPIVTAAAVEEIQAIADNLELLSLPDVGHWPQIDEAETVTAAIRERLSSQY